MLGELYIYEVSYCGKNLVRIFYIDISSTSNLYFSQNASSTVKTFTCL